MRAMDTSTRHALERAAAHTDSPQVAAVLRRLRADPLPSSVVLVEGDSDRVALETLARRRSLDLAARAVVVVVMGGASAIARFVTLFGPTGLDLDLAGLCDAAEASDVARALRSVGLVDQPVGSVRPDPRGEDRELAAVGFHVCHADLEDELVRAVGVGHVERVLADEGDLRSFRTVQHQPAHRDRPTDEVLRRFLGTRSGRKAHYAGRLVEALDLDHAPEPLDAVLDRVTR